MYELLKKIYYRIICFIPTLYFKLMFYGSPMGHRVVAAGHSLFRGGNRAEFGSDVLIGPGSHIEVIGEKREKRLTIGNHFSATSALFISCIGEVHIGYDVLFANNIRIHDSNHGMNPEEKGGYVIQDMKKGTVRIGNGVWCGDNVIMLSGTDIGDHSIIGAGSVVTGMIPEYTVAVGAPARPVKRWNKELKKWEKLEGK